jgi:hypothetical protein
MSASPHEAHTPPEAALIAIARRARGLSPEVAAALTPIRLGGARWREIEKGYRGAGPNRRRVDGPKTTVAHMAHTVGVSPDQLVEAGRSDAAEILREILRQAAAEASQAEEGEPLPYDPTDEHEVALWEIPLSVPKRLELIRLYRKARAEEQQQQPGRGGSTRSMPS